MVLQQRSSRTGGVAPRHAKRRPARRGAEHASRGPGPTLLGVGGWCLLGVLAVLVLAVLAPLALGGRASVVASGSMAPALDVGDLVLVVPTTPEEVRLGEVVVFADPAGSGHTISHRLVDRRVDGAEVVMTTRGDANPTAESWTTEQGARLGRVAFSVPLVGRLVSTVWTPGAHLPLVVAPALGLLVLELVDTWRPARAGAVQQAAASTPLTRSPTASAPRARHARTRTTA